MKGFQKEIIIGVILIVLAFFVALLFLSGVLTFDMMGLSPV
ncbi:MAG: hypothetical protein V1818_03715 [Candidatus Aenigmatarchaeota archaeon]